MNVLPDFPGLRTALALRPRASRPEPPPAQPDAGLYRLPNELVIQVLASCPDLGTLWSLARTSRTLWALFHANATAVVEGVLQQAAPRPLAGVLRAAVRMHLNTLRGGERGRGSPANHLLWAQSPPFVRHEVPAGLLRNVVRLAHDIHVLAHVYLEDGLRRCAAMPREPPRWALGPPSANEVFRVEMSLWRALLFRPFAWNSPLLTEDRLVAYKLNQAILWSEFRNHQHRLPEYWSLEHVWKDMGWRDARRPATAPGASDGMAFTPSVGPSCPMQMPDPEQIARERHGSVWALLRRCACGGPKAAARSLPHLLSDTSTPSWAFYGRHLPQEWEFPSPDKLPGIRARMRSFGLPFWDGERMVALGFPLRTGSDDYQDYSLNLGALYTEDEFRKLAVSASRRRDSAEDLARETYALAHVRDYYCCDQVDG